MHKAIVVIVTLSHDESCQQGIKTGPSRASKGLTLANVTGHYSATIVDGLGTKAPAVAYFNLVDTTTLATLKTDLDAWATALDATTDGVIESVRINISPALTSGLGTMSDKGAAFTASRVEQTAVINFGNTVTPHKSGFAIPAIKAAAITAGKLVLTDTDVAALISLLDGGSFTNQAAQVLSGVIDAILSFRKRRKQLSRTSFEL